VREQLKNLGSNLMLIFRADHRERRAAGHRRGADAHRGGRAGDRGGGRRRGGRGAVGARRRAGRRRQLQRSTQYFGTNNDYLIARDWPLASGRLFEPAEIAGSGKVALIGLTTAKQLFGEASIRSTR